MKKEINPVPSQRGIGHHEKDFIAPIHPHSNSQGFLGKYGINLQSEVFTRTIETIITADELSEKLKKAKPLRIKLGIDATASDLHIGHAVSLWKIRELQEVGHKAVIVLGDFTTRIGDPTGKSATRPMLTSEAIKKNIIALKTQIGKILLTSSRALELRMNSEWFGKMKAEAFLRLTSLVTHARLIERDMFQERIKEGKEIAISEMLYPILQGYDSVMMKSDLTIIGSDQLFNEHMGRFFQEKFGQVPQAIVTVKLLSGLSGGEKMSKSLGNYIALNDTPQDKFGKAMRLIDSLVVPYLEAYTDVPREAIEDAKKKLAEGKNPMEIKFLFAEALTRRYHGAKVAVKEKEKFLAMFSQRGKEEGGELPKIKIKYGSWQITSLLREHFSLSSNAEARRLILQKAVEVDHNIITDPWTLVEIKRGSTVRVGKKVFIRVE